MTVKFKNIKRLRASSNMIMAETSTGEIFTVDEFVNIEPYATYYREILQGLHGVIVDLEYPPCDNVRAEVDSTSMVRFKIGLLNMGALEKVKTELSQLPSPSRERALIIWEHETVINKNTEFVKLVQSILDLDDSELNDFFVICEKDVIL